MLCFSRWQLRTRGTIKTILNYIQRTPKNFNSTVTNFYYIACSIRLTLFIRRSVFSPISYPKICLKLVLQLPLPLLNRERYIPWYNYHYCRGCLDYILPQINDFGTCVLQSSFLQSCRVVYLVLVLKFFNESEIRLVNLSTVNSVACSLLE